MFLKMFNQRRHSLAILLISLSLLMNACTTPSSSISSTPTPTFQDRLVKLENSSSGRIGVSGIHMGNNTYLHYRADEEFPIWSTSKVMVVAAILKKSIANPQLMKKGFVVTKDLVVASGYAPITRERVGKQMSIAELCMYAIQYSDNAAFNLLIGELGGPEAVINFARSIGDDDFSFYRLESKLKSDIYPLNLRFKSNPEAMAKSLQKVSLGEILPVPEREQLQSWLKGNTTGDKRIRAAVPKNWVVGDKTGTGIDFGTTNDIGIIWPPHCSPVTLAIFFSTKDEQDTVHHDDVVASATRILLEEFSKTDQCFHQ